MAELRASNERRADRKIALILGVFVIGVAAPAGAGDIDRALEYAEDTLGDQVIPDYAGNYQRAETTMIPVFVARNMRKGASPDSYQCDNTLIDGQWTLRTSTEDRWSHRRCREEMWKRESLPGYQTLGSVQLNERIVEPWVRRASARTNVPEKLLHLMIRYQSGHRPGVISDEGNVVAEFAVEKRVVISTKDLPNHVLQAFIAAEDKRFYRHPGIDVIGIARAFVNNQLQGRIVGGGSTITELAVGAP